MKTVLLTEAEMHAVLRSVGVDRFMDEMIEALERAFRELDERTEIPVRTGFHYDRPSTGLIEWMPIKTPDGPVAIKVVGYHPDNPRKGGLPTVISTLSSYDTATGQLLAVIDGTLLTAMRTGAASAVASRWMARPSSACLGLIGCGAQAVTQLHALSRLFPLEQVLIHDSDPAVLGSFAGRVRGLLDQSIELRKAPAEAIMREADIVCTVTSVAPGRGPVVGMVETRPWLHINAVGSDFPGKTELPRELLEASFVCPDTPDQAFREGECQQLDPAMVTATIAEVVRGAFPAASLQARRTVFDSTGWAIEDQVAMELALDWAAELGIGTEVAIECLSGDPRDPYGFAAARQPAPRRERAEVGV